MSTHDFVKMWASAWTQEVLNKHVKNPSAGNWASTYGGEESTQNFDFHLQASLGYAVSPTKELKRRVHPAVPQRKEKEVLINKTSLQHTFKSFTCVWIYSNASFFKNTHERLVSISCEERGGKFNSQILCADWLGLLLVRMKGLDRNL